MLLQVPLSLVQTFSLLLFPFYHLFCCLFGDRAFSLVPLLFPWCLRFIPSCEPFSPLSLLFFLFHLSFTFSFSLAIFFHCFLSLCAINFSPLPLFSPFYPPFFFSSHYSLFLPRLGFFLSLCHQLFPSAITLSPLPLLLQVFFFLHGFFPSTIALCAPFCHCSFPFVIALSLLLNMSPSTIVLYHRFLPSAISLFFFNHHTFFFLGLRLSLFLMLNFTPIYHCFFKFFFSFHGFSPSTIAHSPLPLLSPLCYRSFPFVESLSSLPFIFLFPLAIAISLSLE